MATRHGLWISFNRDPDREKIAEAIQERGEVSTTVSDAVIRPRRAEVAIVSVDGDPEYLALVKAGARAVTGKRRIAISRFLPLGVVKIDLPPRVGSALANGSANAHRITPAAWRDLLASVAAKNPNARKHLTELQNAIAEGERRAKRITGDIDIFERDAIASTLQAFGGTNVRKRIVGSAKATNTDVRPATFLDRLTNVSVREDPQIGNDALTFPGLAFARQYQVGAFELDNEQGERLTILNCNRQPLEKTLGVDPIYYNHRYDSFVLVQYKRMTKEGKRAVYRPKSDKNYLSELQRMSEVESLLSEGSQAGTYHSSAYRLSPRPFYMKLCEPTIKSALDEGMVSGMYVPLGLWKSLVASPEAQGALGAVAIGWDNCGRYLNNGEFTNLLRAGWIGSSAGGTRLLDDLIRAVIEGDRMLVLGIMRPASGRADYVRDTYGRFASDDDTLASR